MMNKKLFFFLLFFLSFFDTSLVACRQKNVSTLSFPPPPFDSTRCSLVLLGEMSFPVCYCYCIFSITSCCCWGMGSIITCIRTKSAADLILPKESLLSLKQRLSLSCPFSVIEIHILWPLVFSPALNISARFSHLPCLYDESKVQMLG